MQLTHLTNKLKPITLAAGILSATQSFAYSDFDEYSGILFPTSNSKTEEYIKIADNNDTSYFSRKFKFQYHLTNWEKKTRFFSSPKSILGIVIIIATITIANLKETLNIKLNCPLLQL